MFVCLKGEPSKSGNVVRTLSVRSGSGLVRATQRRSHAHPKIGLQRRFDLDHGVLQQAHPMGQGADLLADVLILLVEGLELFAEFRAETLNLFAEFRAEGFVFLVNLRPEFRPEVPDLRTDQGALAKNQPDHRSKRAEDRKQLLPGHERILPQTEGGRAVRRCENNGAPRFRMTSSRFPDPTRLSDLPLSGRRLLLRADLNVPLEGGQIADDSRIRAAEAGVRMALEAGASVALASHLGRPKGGATDPAALGLAPVAARLSELLEIPLPLAPDVAGPGSRELAAALRPGEALLLENLRFDPGEARNDPDFARRLASLADEYANDAFGAAHRAHASVDACPKLFARPAAGPLLLREIETLGTLLDDPPRPFVAILGGAKISDKLPALDALLARADRVLVGGAMQYTFFAAQGLPVGNSLLEPEQIPWARQLLASAGDRLELPKDQITATDPRREGRRGAGGGAGRASPLDGPRHRECDPCRPGAK